MNFALTIRGKFQFILLVLQVFVIFVLAFLLSLENISINAFAQDEDYTWEMSEDEEGRALFGIEFLEKYDYDTKGFDERTKDYEKILENDDEGSSKFVESSRIYALGSIDLMIYRLSLLQHRIQRWQWMTPGDRLEMVSKVNFQIRELMLLKERTEEFENVEEIRSEFRKAKDMYDDFMNSLLSLVQETQDLYISPKCEAFLKKGKGDVEQYSTHEKKYRAVQNACQDWQVEHVSISETMLEFIKIVK